MSLTSASYANSSDAPYPDSYRHAQSYNADVEMRSVLSSTRQILEQAQSPPPSLREILGAYKAKGDGDRDMLIAMLNAKSAEDQRLASVAALHRQVIELYQTCPPSHPQNIPPPHLPHLHIPPPPHHYHAPYQTPPLSHPPRSPPHSMPPMRDQPPRSSQQPSRKRRRSSRSPARSHSSRSSTHELPPSPRSDSLEYSPRSRASMAIGSLLTVGSGASRAAEEDTHSQISAERNHHRGRNERSTHSGSSRSANSSGHSV
ncbi:hypothetical protein PLICRDRAFT_35573 [Plicaturopsis crispa FD-325 SS-3]|nr:hypothetical protein PLICRDRAFT_35573 [Plicaturopsis crispa FD-325 SS-3]